jgi:hypothetical protein
MASRHPRREKSRFPYEVELRRLKLVREWIAVFAGLIRLAYLFATLLDNIL